MGTDKKQIRKNFRDACYKRDKYCCVMCDFKSSQDKAEEELDAHHITSRTKMLNGGYVRDNGISLCSDCHLKAEVFHSTGQAHPNYSPDDLYSQINSNLEKATAASEKLK